MSKNPKGPVQQDKPKIPTGPKQPYGQPISGSHQDKMKQQDRNKNQAGKGM